MSKSAILQPGATDKQLERAVMENHATLFARNATANGGAVRVDGGLVYTFNGSGGQAMVTFHGGEIGEEELDLMMSFYRRDVPSSIGYWCLHPAMPKGIGARLLARGFQDGWRPCWMALALEEAAPRHDQPGGLEIKRGISDVASVPGLPYWGKDSAVSDALMRAHPQQAHKFVGFLDGKIVGHCAIFLADGVAGLYSMGVLPKFRNRGIGKALVTEACLYARSQGYHYAVLNGTGRRMYEQVGFRWIGDGHTWWVVNKDVFTTEPDPVQVALAEAVGLGDVKTLDKIWKRNHGAFDLNKPLLNGHSMMDLAVSCRQPAGAEWLVQHGVSVGVLQAWDLGWKDRAAAMLKENASLVNRRVGERGETILHIAAERGDTPLARLALSAKPDLSIKDTAFNNDALGWAKFLGRFEIARLIEGQ